MTITVQEHLEHMTDGRWHDDCGYCLRRRVKGGTGVPDDEMTAERNRAEAARADHKAAVEAWQAMTPRTSPTETGEE